MTPVAAPLAEDIRVSTRAPADDGPLRALYEAHAATVLRALRRYGVQSSDLEDCMHEVFIVALKKRSRELETSSDRAWLVGVARRVASTERRGRDRRLQREQQAPVPPPSPCPEAHSTTRERSMFVERFIATLDELNREIFVLSEVEQLSAPEISTLLHVNVNTVYTRIARCRKVFRRAAAQHYEESNAEAP